MKSQALNRPVSRGFTCQCAGQDANSNHKIGFSFWGKPCCETFFVFILMEVHFLWDYISVHRGWPASLSQNGWNCTPRKNRRIQDRNRDVSENVCCWETWKSLVFNHEGCPKEQGTGRAIGHAIMQNMRVDMWMWYLLKTLVDVSETKIRQTHKQIERFPTPKPTFLRNHWCDSKTINEQGSYKRFAIV